ncbi:hypothetical protein BRADI_3g40060v3 [Brachypodium distachyon]|uniref:Bromo domain-containing protein n=1 Tax=Brachypodium distachyon TaxID=15368 RepID=A0A2K2D280_BRADI|nr:hypothetical protein BRADI_3g40060v3 [Brachypodium distachyon]
MADGSNDPDDAAPDSPAAGGEIWGTLEELLLACLVNRHGGACWEKVAEELRARVPAAAAAVARFTPESCRLRFRLIRRRFAAGDAEADGEELVAAAASCMEELRKLRVAELRREVERHDLSIGALESKVKRLKEEREKSLSAVSGETTPASEEEQEEAMNESPEEAGGENGVSGADGHAAVEDEDEPDAGAVKEEEENASGESVAAPKEADAEEKESSDVQSSASPSKRRLRKVGGEALSSSASAPLPAAEAEPLLAFLESVRASKSGSVFERRLESQECGKYRSTIRCHVDLEMIRSKLESGGPTATTGKGGSPCYYTSASEFYRDLLLLCANALVFFPRGSMEQAAAARTRALVSKRISGSLPGGAAGKKPKPEAEAEGSLMEKSTPIMVSRKRSSIAKAAANAGKEEKVEKADDTDEEEEQDEEEEEDKKKKRGSASGRTLRSSKTREPAMNGSPVGRRTRSKGSAAAAAAEASKKPDKKSGGRGKAEAAGEGGVVKKRNAVDFLNRMKQSSSQSTERVSLLETLKLSATEQTEEKKAGRGKDNGSSSSSRRSAAAETPPSRGRRNVGRPPKRAAAPPSPPPPKRAKAEDRPATRRRGRK